MCVCVFLRAHGRVGRGGGVGGAGLRLPLASIELSAHPARANAGQRAPASPAVFYMHARSQHASKKRSGRRSRSWSAAGAHLAPSRQVSGLGTAQVS